MSLYVQLWPVWVILAVLSCNLLKVLAAALSEVHPLVTLSNVAAAITAIFLAIASVMNVVVCLSRMFSAS